jgi:hypothetical protein
VRSFLLLVDFYFWKLSLYRGDNFSVLWLSRTSCQGISSMRRIGNRIFPCAFFYEIRFRKFFSRSSSQFGHFRRFSFGMDLAGSSVSSLRQDDSAAEEIRDKMHILYAGRIRSPKGRGKPASFARFRLPTGGVPIFRPFGLRTEDLQRRQEVATIVITWRSKDA